MRKSNGPHKYVSKKPNGRGGYDYKYEVGGGLRLDRRVNDWRYQPPEKRGRYKALHEMTDPELFEHYRFAYQQFHVNNDAHATSAGFGNQERMNMVRPHLEEWRDHIERLHDEASARLHRKPASELTTHEESTGAANAGQITRGAHEALTSYHRSMADVPGEDRDYHTAELARREKADAKTEKQRRAVDRVFNRHFKERSKAMKSQTSGVLAVLRKAKAPHKYISKKPNGRGGYDYVYGHMTRQQYDQARRWEMQDDYGASAKEVNEMYPEGAFHDDWRQHTHDHAAAGNPLPEHVADELHTHERGTLDLIRRHYPTMMPKDYMPPDVRAKNDAHESDMKAARKRGKAASTNDTPAPAQAGKKGPLTYGDVLHERDLSGKLRSMSDTELHDHATGLRDLMAQHYSKDPRGVYTEGPDGHRTTAIGQHITATHNEMRKRGHQDFIPHHALERDLTPDDREEVRSKVKTLKNGDAWDVDAFHRHTEHQQAQYDAMQRDGAPREKLAAVQRQMEARRVVQQKLHEHEFGKPLRPPKEPKAKKQAPKGSEQQTMMFSRRRTPMQKSAGAHKYVRRDPKPGGGFRYVYHVGNGQYKHPSQMDDIELSNHNQRMTGDFEQAREKYAEADVNDKDSPEAKKHQRKVDRMTGQMSEIADEHEKRSKDTSKSPIEQQIHAGRALRMHNRLHAHHFHESHMALGRSRDPHWDNRFDEAKAKRDYHRAKSDQVRKHYEALKEPHARDAERRQMAKKSTSGVLRTLHKARLSMALDRRR